MSNTTETTALPTKNLLVLCGSSGSGKSTLEENLIEEYPQYFHKWQQVTTRKPRSNESPGNPYIFVQRDTFQHLKDKLVGRLGLAENTLFPELYGSIPDFVNGKVSTVILAEEAINDIKTEIREGRLNVDNVFIFGLDVAYEDLNQKDLREGRDESFIAKERSVLNHANMVYRKSNGKYINPSLLVTILKEAGLITE